MTAQILKFPEVKRSQGYKIPLYTNDEIMVTCIAINTFSNLKHKVTESDLPNYDPVIVIESLVSAKNSEMFSTSFKKIISTILRSIETIELKG